MTSLPRVGIVGAGISGLATAYFLQKESFRRGLEINLEIFERSDHLGGVIRTEKAGDFLLEAGPEALVSAKPAAVELIEELGLSHDVIGSNDQFRRTFVASDGKLRPLPDGLALFAPIDFRAFCSTSLISTRGKLRALLEPLVRPTDGDPTVRSFLQRRLGWELTQKIAEPLVSAIYGGDIEKLSAASALPDVYRAEQKFGSLWKGLRAVAKSSSCSTWPTFLTPLRGMEQLVTCLRSRLDNSAIHCGITDIKIFPNSGSFRIESTKFKRAFDALVLCAPAPASGKALHSLSPEASYLLNQIPYTSTAVVYLGYKRSEFSHPLRGFGFVVPQNEADALDACTWVSSKFQGRSPVDSMLLRCAIHDGRRPRPPVSDQEIAERAHGELRRILGISCLPVFSRVFRARKAMPQLNVGHTRRMERIKTTLARHPGLFVSGAFCGGVGIPDCARAARETAKAAVEFLQRR